MPGCQNSRNHHSYSQPGMKTCSTGAEATGMKSVYRRNGKIASFFYRITF